VDVCTNKFKAGSYGGWILSSGYSLMAFAAACYCPTQQPAFVNGQTPTVGTGGSYFSKSIWYEFTA
jgi:hypothetical protein